MVEEGLLSRLVPRRWLPWLTYAAAGVALIRCSDGTEYVLDGAGEVAPQLGTAGFHLDVGSGLVFNQFTATLQFPDATSQTQTLDVSPDDSSLTIYLGELPVGSGYQVTLSGTSTTGAVCTGSTEFRIKQDETVVVNVRMECSGGSAQPDVGAAVIKGEVVPATGECPAVIERIELAPARAGIGVPVEVEVFPTAGTAPLITLGASGGQLQLVAAAPAAGGGQQGGGQQGGGQQGGGAQAAGGAQIAASELGAQGSGEEDEDEVAPVITLARSTNTRAIFRCTEAGEFEVYAEAIRAGCVHETEAIVRCFDDGTPYTGGAGGGSGGGQGGGAGTAGSAGAAGLGGGAGSGGASNACTTCTAASCPAQVTACQTDATSAACQEIRVCAAVGTAASCASNSSLDCYCGTRPIATCLTFGGNGECADVITRASGCDDGRAAENIPTCVSERFLEVNFGLGDAFQLVACQRRNCSTQCGLVP